MFNKILIYIELSSPWFSVAVSLMSKNRPDEIRPGQMPPPPLSLSLMPQKDDSTICLMAPSWSALNFSPFICLLAWLWAALLFASPILPLAVPKEGGAGQSVPKGRRIETIVGAGLHPWACLQLVHLSTPLTRVMSHLPPPLCPKSWDQDTKAGTSTKGGLIWS